MRRAIVSLLALALLLPSPLAPALAETPRLSVQGESLVDEAGQPRFLLGANYEGPADRAWRMWDDDAFDPAAIDQDFARARAANVSVLRLFVQRALAEDVQARRWKKLDRVLKLADQHGLRLILTFADYAELDLARVAAVDAAIARRYRDRATILAYDLKNEPRFGDLALASYPPGLNAPLQRPELVAAVGETVARQDVPAYRASDPGQREVPARLSDDQAYVYVNTLAAYRRLLHDALDWARAHNSTIVQYLGAPDSAGWEPLKQALNDTLAAWLTPQLDAVRAADPGRPITVGHVDVVLGSLPVNAWLDLRSLHQYPGPSNAGIAASLRVLDDVKAAVPGKPLLLSEFGLSTVNLDEQQAAALEAQLVLGARDHGAVGALKWMLNDVPNGFNPRENAFGMYHADGSPKPVVAAFQALGDLAPAGARGTPRDGSRGDPAR